MVAQRPQQTIVPTLTPAANPVILRRREESAVTGTVNPLLPDLQGGLPHRAALLFVHSLEPALEVKPLAAAVAAIARGLGGDGGKVSVDGGGEVRGQLTLSLHHQAVPLHPPLKRS